MFFLLGSAVTLQKLPRPAQTARVSLEPTLLPPAGLHATWKEPQGVALRRAGECKYVLPVTHFPARVCSSPKTVSSEQTCSAPPFFYGGLSSEESSELLVRTSTLRPREWRLLYSFIYRTP